MEQRISLLNTLSESLPVGAQYFESRNLLAGLGKRLSKRKIADERTLEYFMHLSIEDPVRAIVEQVSQIDKVRELFDMGNGIVFENHPHAISDIGEEVLARVPPSTPPSRQDLTQLRPDQICIYRSGNDSCPEKRTMLYVSEYKAPHKLTAPHLRDGLQQMNDIHKEVVNRTTIPAADVDPAGNFKYHAERLTASALAQTYHYMIEGGLEYGLMTTGEAIVFLKVDWKEPETLYFHLSEPGPEVEKYEERVQFSSAVGQYLAFTLMALGKPGEHVEHPQDERDQVKARLKRWAVDFELALRSIPETERRPPDSASSWAPTTHDDFELSPINLKGGRFRPGRGCDDRNKYARRRDESESSDDESGGGPPDPSSPSEQRRRRADANRARKREENQAQQPRQGTGDEGQRRYCTQACLLGLVRGGAMDPRCPNAECHDGPRGRTRAPHPISHSTWLQLLREQMRRTLDGGITKLGKSGARGVLFKVTLLSHGYTFVCKGTVEAFIPDLEHEAAVYKRLERVQGVHVPVFLGAVDLRPLKRTYYYDFRVYIVHMTLLSWAGDEMGDVKATRMLEAKAAASLQAMHNQGVVHRDVRRFNMLFNEETQSVMMIDFERAVLLKPLRRCLVQTSPNKRKSEPANTTTSAKGSSGKASGWREVMKAALAEDKRMLRGTFLELERCCR
ncbi:hypothetical protein XA68_11979 [Ophiocordyceps unilateralis]|uniref:Protein kinase domain-containing protein n=1 Tax=Ophiocordyceps unilateralis TaxID=268505 RepID=A0A2A9PPL4_OPHUN|nr:hypothetical protein XA68_11979 [Ophiocordyceps unilateralis]